jgi:hypothetical protein
MFLIELELVHLETLSPMYTHIVEFLIEPESLY